MVLFQPGRLGDIELPNRLVMAPLARARSLEPSREPPQRVVTYYSQRATAGLIISESGHVAADSVSRWPRSHCGCQKDDQERLHGFSGAVTR